MKSFLLCLGCCLTFVVMQAQTEIRGVVQDAKTGELMPGVTVTERGSTNGAVTNNMGVYSINISNPAALLEFSFIGYETDLQNVRGRSSIDVQLTESFSELSEVVVTALNLERSSKDLGYSIQQIDAQTLNKVQAPNFVDNIAAQVAGVQINQGATGVGSSSKITIRGESSFTNNNPLFVVDGVPINNNTNFNFTNEAAAGFQSIDFGNGGMEINSDDIAQLSVLKGPSAAALYGTRAANGVILITTKDGSNSDGLGISVNSSVFFDQPFQLPDFQNKYGQGNSGEFEFVDGLGGGINDNITYSWGPELDQGLLIPQFDSPVTLPDGSTVRGGDVAVHGGAPIEATPFESHPDNLKDFYETGVTALNNISIASQFDKGHYRVSLSDLRSKSFIPGVNYNRTNASANLTFRPVKRLKIQAIANYVNSQSDNRPSSGYGSENINYSLVAWGPRSLNIESLEDYWQPGLEERQQYSFNYTFFDNPYFILHENRNSFGRDRVFGNLIAEYQFTDNWKLMAMSGIDYSNELRQFRRHFSTNRFAQGAYAEQSALFKEQNTNILLNYRKRFNNISVDVSFGGNRMDQRIASRQSQTLSLATPGIFNFSNAASPIQVFQQEQRKRINSVYGFAKVGYRNFLFAEVTGRNDWSSALANPNGGDEVSFFYPSTSLSYVLSNHVELPSAISFAKLRASWAQVGNDTDPYQTASAFVAGVPFNSQPTFTGQDAIANNNLKPERTNAYEVGADVRFLKDRVRFDITYFNSTTSNQIIALPVSVSSGFTQQVVNGGKIQSQGLEVIAGFTPVKTNSFEWNSIINFSRQVSTVQSLPDGADKITLAYSRVYDNVNQTVWFQVEEGGRVGDIYGTGYLKNENGDFVIDDNGRFIADNTLRKLGNYNPDFTIGFTNNFNYKNWNLSFLIDWRQGGELVSRTLSLAAVGGQLIETENRPEDGIIADGVVNTGTAENPIWTENTTAVSAESYYRLFYDRNHEENNVYSATFVKLRQFSIGYTFKKEKSKGFFKTGRALNVALIGRNLFAFSAIPHFDPEQLAVQGNGFVSGVEDMSYPTARSIGFKLGYDF